MLGAALSPLAMIVVDYCGILEAWILFIEFFLDLKGICIHPVFLSFSISVPPRHSAAVQKYYSLPSILFTKIAASLWPVFLLLKSRLVCEKAPCDQQYFMVLRQQRFRRFGEFEGLRGFGGLGGPLLLPWLVLLLVVAREETCCWGS